MRYSIFAMLFLCSLAIFSTAYTQTTDPAAQATINVELLPKTPGSNELVSVMLTSYATNLNAASITWTVNGKTQKTGTGATNFNFTTGAMGTKTVLNITIKTVEGLTIQKNYSIRPSEVDMMWQSESFVPPFYKGKAMFSHQNRITFIAMPHLAGSNGQEINIKNLIYKWKKNGSVVEDTSGYGRNTYSFVSSLISRPMNIEVEVTSTNEEGVGYGSIYVEPQDPSIIMYRKDPLYGIEFQKALQNTVSLGNSQEITVIGMPFFFGNINPSAVNLSYKWSINDVPIGNDPSAMTQVFRQKDGTSGASKVSLSVESSNKILQYASGDFNLRFENKGTNNSSI